MLALPPTDCDYLIMNNRYVSLLTGLLSEFHMLYFVLSFRCRLRSQTNSCIGSGVNELFSKLKCMSV